MRSRIRELLTALFGGWLGKRDDAEERDEELLRPDRVDLLLEKLAERIAETKEHGASYRTLSQIVADAAYLLHFYGIRATDEVGVASPSYVEISSGPLGDDAYKQGKKQGKRDRKRLEQVLRHKRAA
jgi:hypothetical protein